MPMQRRLRREFLRRWIQLRRRQTASRGTDQRSLRHRLGSKPLASMVCGNDCHFQQKFMIYDVSIENTNYRLELNRTTTGWTCSLNGRPVQLDVALIPSGMERLLIEIHACAMNRAKV